MSTSTAFRVAADLIEDIEAGGGAVTEVSPESGRLVSEAGFAAEMLVEVPLLDDPESADGIALEVTDAHLRPDGSLALSVSLCTGKRTPGSSSSAASGATSDGSDRPIHRDPEALREVYESYETFPEMRDALGVDVEPQTVRKHMIKNGIHEPSPPDAGDADVGSVTEADSASDDARTSESTQEAEDTREGDDAGKEDSARPREESREPAESGGMNPDPDEGSDSAEEILTADGIGLPQGVTLDDLREAVRNSRTLHGVQQRTGMDRETTREFLLEFGLMDLVFGRIDSVPDDRPVSPEEVDRRIRESLDAGR